jgi:hypothetical protein
LAGKGRGVEGKVLKRGNFPAKSNKEVLEHVYKIKVTGGSIAAVMLYI